MPTPTSLAATHAIIKAHEPHGGTPVKLTLDRAQSPSILAPQYGSDNSRTSERVSRPRKRRYSRQSFESARQTDAVHKINDSFFDAISAEDIQQLFDVLDEDNHGLLDRAEFGAFLMEVLDPPFSECEVEAIFNLTDMRPDGKVAPEELSRAFKDGTIKLQLAQLHQNYRVRRGFNVSQGVGAPVKRDLLMERLAWRLRRDDAFATLPFSSVFTLVFLSLVANHLRIWNRQQVERGLESWISDYGADLSGPYLKQAVAGTSSFWSWLSTSGASAVFGQCHNITSNGAPLCHLATQNVLIGDAQLQQRRTDGLERAEWLLHSAGAHKHLAAAPGNFLGAAVGALQQLQQSGWVGDETDSLKLVFSTYNERDQMFAVTEVAVDFDSYGYVVPVVVTSAASVDPYPSKALFALDAFYIFCVLHPFYCELRDLISLCRTVGCVKGIISYSGFWNAVDWLNILMSMLLISMWVQCCLAMQADSIKMLLAGGMRTQSLMPRVMQLDSATLDMVRNDLADIISLFKWLHVAMAANVFVIMLKFFKAFQANPKLQLVTNTLTRAASDILHFCVVSSAVFVGFALIGHIVFGGDILQFNTFPRSLNTAFIVLMGDFEWYVKESESDVGLGSGVPWLLLATWFWLFMVCNFLILLNMLMAIVLEHYNDCFNEVKVDPDAIALWVQAWRFVKQLRKTQGHIPLSQILCQLVDESQFVHPDDNVTSASLMEAFGMTKTQADFLMKWLNKEARKRRKQAEGGEDKVLARMVEVEGFMEGMAEILRIVSLNISQCSKALQERPDFVDDASTADAADGVELAEEIRMQTDNTEDLERVVAVLRDALARLCHTTCGSDSCLLSPAAVGARSCKGVPEEKVVRLGLEDSSRGMSHEATMASCCFVQKALKAKVEKYVSD
mmetsp:Transcript_16174/g.44502  ORF Transcript_16174/g.44502 Transcript_16174/m.44502 type:complete len:902 (-) Transcript_16174:113-2818(-)